MIKNLVLFSMMLYVLLGTGLSSALISPKNCYKNRIEQLVKSNPHQLSVKEYTLIAEQVLKKTPCSMLVFGVGNDSTLWMDLNKKGTTVFLEDNNKWLTKIKTEIPRIQAHLIQYKHTRKEWAELLSKLDKKALLIDLPPQVLSKKWDIIFVDAPEGWSNEKPGRMSSIFMAALLAHKNKNTHVFVHDCDRQVESLYSTIFLNDKYLQKSVDRLRYYFVP